MSQSPPQRNFAVDEVNRPGMVSIKKMALRGSAWSIMGFGAAKTLKLAGNLILTRLLFPEAFGIIALVEMVLHAVQMFSDLGIGAGVIRDPRGNNPHFFNTAWTLQVIRGIVLWLLTCIVAYPISIAYQEPLLMYLLPFTGLTALIDGFSSTSILQLRRQVKLKPLVIWELANQAFGLVCLIGLAWYLRSVWALAVGSVIRIIGAVVTSHFLIPGRKPRFTWDRSAVHDLVQFGKWIFLSTAVTFLLQQGDRAILGLFVTKQTLGLFAIATVWSRMSIEALLRLNSQVMFPIYADLHNRGDRQLRRRVFKARLGLIAIFVPLMWCLSLGGQLLIDILYDARYTEAGWMLQILAAGGVAAVISATASNILLALGDSKSHMFLQVGRSLLLIACISIGASQAGTVGMIVGVAASRVISYPLLAWAIRRHGMWMPALDLCTLGVSALVLYTGWVYLSTI
jgi:O-antigen/teichoic acid export membrane protein